MYKTKAIPFLCCRTDDDDLALFFNPFSARWKFPTILSYFQTNLFLLRDQGNYDGLSRDDPLIVIFDGPPPGLFCIERNASWFVSLSWKIFWDFFFTNSRLLRSLLVSFNRWSLSVLFIFFFLPAAKDWNSRSWTFDFSSIDQTLCAV